MDYRKPERDALDSGSLPRLAGVDAPSRQVPVEERIAGTKSVYYIVGGLSIGGTERHLSLVLPELKRRGLSPRVCVLDVQGPMAGPIRAAGIEIDDWTESFRQFSMRRRRVLEPLVSLALIVRLALAIRRLQPDICHAYLPKACILGGLAARLAGHRCFVASRRSQNTYLARHRFAGWVEKRLMRGAAAVLGNSRAVVTELAADGVPANKLGLIYNGVNRRSLPGVDDRAAARRREGIADNALVLLTVANLIPYKGHRDLIEAIVSIRDQLPQPWRLILAGRDDGIRASLHQRAEHAGIADNLLFIQDRCDLESLYQAADIAILPSHEEGFPNAIIEAMGAGLPVIATNVGGIPDALEPGRTGLLVSPRRPVELGRAVLELAQDPDRRLRMGQNGRSKADQEFSLNVCIDRYVRLYRELGTVKARAVSELIS